MNEPLEIIDVPQGSEEWQRLRAGLVTMSVLDEVMAKPKEKGAKESLTRAKLLRTLVGEIITGEPAEGFSNRHTERGIEMEAEAVRHYEFFRDVDTQPGGFWRRGRVGASPDRRVGERRALEAKTKLPAILLEVHRKGELPAEHRKQIQGQLWVGRGQLEAVDFIAYWPGMKPFITTVEPDLAFHREIEDAVGLFLKEMDSMLAWYRSL